MTRSKKLQVLDLIRAHPFMSQQELAQTSVAVVCAGAKSILDLGLTLEYLETHGVPVISVGQAGFPAFFTRDSGFKADFQLYSAVAWSSPIRFLQVQLCQKRRSTRSPCRLWRKLPNKA